MSAADMGFWLQRAMFVIVLCGFYMPLAVAFALVQGISNRIFLSFGDVAIFAAFAAVYVALARYVAGDASILVISVSLIVAMACAGAMGHFVSRQIFAPLIRQPSQAFMIAAVGFSIMLQEIMRLQSSAKTIWLPPLYGIGTVQLPSVLGGMQTSMIGLISAGASLLAVAVVALIMRRTPLGRQWQACSQDARLAALTGIDVGRVVQLTCICSSALTAFSGWTIAVSYGGVAFNLGLMASFKAMFASVIGGFGTLRGAVAGSIFLATAEIAWSSFFPLSYRDAAIFALITCVLVLKPEGLLGSSLRKDSDQ
jgi:branched-chain amino acid transport system permease protein